MDHSKLARGCLAIVATLCSVITARAQAPLTVHVNVVGSTSKKAGSDSSNVAVWLTPADPQGRAALAASSSPVKIVQRNKTFEPHVTVVRTGSYIDFPNDDPFFHNVFSLYNGKRFDLGLYEAGQSKPVRFDRPGVSYLFCNIHENMSAVVIAVDTPYYGVSDHAGQVSIPHVPDGSYTLHVFYERSTAEELKSLERQVTITASSRSIDALQVTESPNVTLAHKNKYGEDYVPPPSSGYGP